MDNSPFFTFTRGDHFISMPETLLRRLTSPEPELLASLSTLLIDCVENGASVGFLSPLHEDTAKRYWQDVLASLGEGLVLWVVETEGKVIGSVQLSLCLKENGRHRAEVQKLFVHSAFRGRGIASQLLRELESYALQAGRTLLVLDTETGSPAESIYQHLGWTRLGEIPDYALSPNGVLHPTTYFYKQIGNV